LAERLQVHAHEVGDQRLGRGRQARDLQQQTDVVRID
jgi:hypothetical protein